MPELPEGEHLVQVEVEGHVTQDYVYLPVGIPVVGDAAAGLRLKKSGQIR